MIWDDRRFADEAKAEANLSSSDRGELDSDRGELDSDRGELGADRRELSLPPELQAAVTSLSKMPRKERLQAVITQLCAWRPMRPADLSAILSIRADNLTERHLTPMLEAGVLLRTHLENPTHPEQAYRAADNEPAKLKTHFHD